MMDEFDPYHSWLGIPPRHQPPNHYRLLGVQAFESDVEVIANAADRQMGHVRTYQTGKHEDLSQRILNEIAKAKVCLLNPQKKAGYDEQLRGQQQSRRPGSKEPRIIQAKPLSEPNSGGVEAAPTIITGVASAPQVTTSGSSNTGRPGLSRGPASRPAWKSPLAIAAACSTVPLLIIAVVVVSVRMAPKERQQEVAQHEFETPTSGKTEPDEDDKGSVSGDGNPQDTNGATRPIPESPVIGVDPPSVDPTPPIVIETDPPPKDVEAVDPSPRDDAPAESKAPPPDAAAVRAAEILIADLFELDKQRTGSARHAAAKNLLKAAAEEEKNTPAHYALLCSGRDLAASVADVGTAFGAIDRLDAVYAVDVWAMKLQVLETASRKVPKDGLASFIVTTTEMTQQAMADDRYEVADGIARLATASARRTKDRDLIREAAALASHATRVQKEFQATIAPALAKLKTSPDDPEANLIAGKHYCLNRAAWQIGLKMLAQSAHEKIKAAAQLDRSEPTDSRKQVVVGDAWYEVANSDKTFEGFHARAHYWYEQALGELGGLTKLKVEKRMQETAKTAARAPKLAAPRMARKGTDSGSASGRVRAVLKTTVTVTLDANIMGHVVFSPDSATLAVGYPRRVRFLDVAARKFGLQLEDMSGSLVHSIAYSPDGRTFLTGNSSGSFTLWDPRTGKEGVTAKAGSQRIRSIVFTPDGTRVILSIDSHTFMVVGTSKWQPVGMLANPKYGIGRLAISADGAVAAIAHTTNGWVSLVDVGTAKYKTYLKGHTAPVTGMAFSADGQLLVTGSSDRSVRLWNAKSYELVKVLNGHKAAVLDVAFAPNSKVLASVSADNTVRLWGTTGKMLLKLEGHASGKAGDTGSIVFSPDGRHLASCGNYTLKIWRVGRH
ncbi:MAG: hypothetical protein IID44_21500 [Planctomycetes bacterium]|nr:hypothetical protein [Planctomycetota bacterium]